MSIVPSLITHCSPTLAGMKVGSLFSFLSPDWKELARETETLNAQLAPKGLTLRFLRIDDGRALCYLYRRSQLEKLLEDPAVRAFLSRYGYDSPSMDAVLSRLLRRMAASGAFPHEIGLFLGYPLSDVIAFIEHHGRGGVCCGCWKAYTNEREARKTFARFSKCTEVYGRLYRAGRRLTQLTVAA